MQVSYLPGFFFGLNCLLISPLPMRLIITRVRHISPGGHNTKNHLLCTSCKVVRKLSNEDSPFKQMIPDNDDQLKDLPFLFNVRGSIHGSSIVSLFSLSLTLNTTDLANSAQLLLNNTNSLC